MTLEIPVPPGGVTAVVMGASAGGLAAFQTILAGLPEEFPASVMVVQHRQAAAVDLLPDLLARVCPLPVESAADKTLLCPGQVYVAPPNYHLLVERGGSLSLSVDPRVSYARPSIDVLFETAAAAFGERLIGVLLTGANHDGTAGFRAIKNHGGLTVAQDPETAEARLMPLTAVRAGVVDVVLPLDEIAKFLVEATSTW